MKARSVGILAAILSLVLLARIACAGATTILLVRTDAVAFVAIDSKVVTIGAPETAHACKLEVANNIIFAAVGILQDFSGPYDLFKFFRDAADVGGSFDVVIARFESTVLRVLPQSIMSLKERSPRAYEETMKRHSTAAAIFAKEENGVIRVSYRLFSDQLGSGNIIVSRVDCPDGQNCPGRDLSFQLGQRAAIVSELTKHPTVWTEKGIVGAMNYLIGLQAIATPQQVGPPVTIVSMDRSGHIRWLQRGLCRQQH